MFSLLPWDPSGSGEESYGGLALSTYLPISTALCGRRQLGVVKAGERKGGKQGERRGTLTLFQLHLDLRRGIRN